MRSAPWIAVGGLTFALLAVPLFGQNPKPAEAKKTAALPITKVTLFNAGIGYFLREGTVDGNAHIDLKVNEEDVNDLILTLIANDPSGKAQAVTYDNKAPAEITLKAFSIDLTENPGLGSLLHQVRGEKVEITDQNGSLIQGQVVSVEKPAPAMVNPDTTYLTSEEGPKVRPVLVQPPAGAVEQVSLLTEDGVQTLPLGRIKKVKFAKAELQAEFRKALEALAAARGASTKTVGVTFTGQGQRKVSLGYAADAPLWKPTYRITLGDKPKIQGYAAIENTTDDDWENVQVKLVSGRPVTFKMDLYDPLFVPRPMVEPELYASLRPPMYAGVGPANMGNNLAQFGANVQNGAQFQGFGGGGNLGVGGGFQGGVITNSTYAYGGITRPSVRSLLGGRMNYNDFTNRAPMEPEKKVPAGAISSNLNTVGNLGESFEFTVAAPVSLARFKSALVPLIDNTVEAKAVSIYNPQIQESYPMKGVYLKNTTKFFFPKGPVSVYEKETMSGQALLPDLNPGETRLMSYAIDLDTLVKKHETSIKKEQLSYKLVNAGLNGRVLVRETTRYSAFNKSDAEKTVWITQPIQTDWKLVSPEKPIEQTAQLYRFEIKVPAKTTVHVDVVETQEVDGLVDLAAGPTGEGHLLTVKSTAPVYLETPVSQTIRDGKLHETIVSRATYRYTIANNDTKPYTVPVFGDSRTGWKLIAPAPLPNGPLNKYQTELIVPAGGDASVTNVEQQENSTSTPLADVSLEKIEKLLALKTIPPAVAAALKKIQTMRIAMRDAEAGANDENAAIKEVKDDQTRIRANIERVPKDSDAYKRYLKKFDDQETELEDRTAKVKAHLKLQAKTKADLALFIRDLTAE